MQRCRCWLVDAARQAPCRVRNAVPRALSTLRLASMAPDSGGRGRNRGLVASHRDRRPGTMPGPRAKDG